MPMFRVYFDAVIHVSSFCDVEAPTPETAEDAVAANPRAHIDSHELRTATHPEHIVEIAVTDVEEDEEYRP